MAYTEILSNRAGLRNQTYTPEGIQLAQRNEIDASSQFGRGIRSAGLQEEVGFLADSANNAYRNGDTALAQALELQMQDKAAQAQQWAPTTQNFTDINSVGTAMDWATGSLGQGLRSTLLPAAGSLVGAGAGALTGIVTKNPALGAKVGAGVGGFLGGYNMEANETIANAMMDPAIRENASMQEIKDTGRAKGVAAGALEAVVPAMMVGKAAGIAGRVGKGQRLANIGKSAGQGAITEFGTEASQDVTGQVAENSLQREDLSSIDPMQAFNAGMAGAVAGGGMGAMGGAAQNITSALGTGADKVNAVRKDPVGAITDGITDLGAKAGTALAKGEAWAKSKFENHFNEEAVQLGRLMSADADNESVGKDAALQHAQRVLAREDSSEDSKKRAAELINNQLDWRNYRDRVTTEAIETRRSRMDDDLANEIAQRTGEGKQSRMSPTLTDDFGEQEGRNKDLDSVTDDFGNRVAGALKAKSVSAYDAAVKAIQKKDIPASMRMDIEAGALGEERQQRIGNAADIFRKQGVPESLIKAGSALDTSDHQSAVATMGWVARGFTDVEGNLFVPESFTRKHKANSVKRIVEATKLAVDRGLLDAEVANRDIAAISDMAKKQWADQTNVFDTVFDAIPKNQFGRQWSRFEVEEFIPELRRMAQNGTTKREEEFLDQLFGSKENIAKAMSAFKEPTNESLRTDEATPNAGESDDLDYATKEKTKAPRLVGLMGGVDENATPFDTKAPSQRKLAESILGTTQLSDHPGSVGIVDHYTSGLDGDAKRSAQNDLLDAHGEEYLDDKQRAMLNAHGVSVSSFIEGLHHNTRTAILNKINNRFRYVTENMEAQAEQAADKVYNPESFAEDFDARGDKSTVHNGSLFLETNGSTPFKTSAMRVLRHVWRAAGKEQTTTNQAQGAHNRYQQLMQGLAALMESSDKFTGRIGFKTHKDAGIKWLDGQGQLPKEFRFNSKTATNIEDALKEMEQARRSGDKERYETVENDPELVNIGYAETFEEKRVEFSKLRSAIEARILSAQDRARERFKKKYPKWNNKNGQDALQQRLDDAEERVLVRMAKEFGLTVPIEVEENGETKTVAKTLNILKAIDEGMTNEKAANVLYTKLRNFDDTIGSLEGFKDGSDPGLIRGDSSVETSRKGVVVKEGGKAIFVKTGATSFSGGDGTKETKTSGRKIQKTQGEKEDNSTLLDKVLKGTDANDLVKGTSLAADPQSEIHRNADGSRAGFDNDALFGAVEGHAKRSVKADENISQADRTKGDKHAKQSAADKAAQWAFDAIRKGMPAFYAGLKKMTGQQVEKLERGLKQISSMGVRGLQENFASMDASEAKKILFYATNAVLHLQKRTDLVGMKNERVDGTGQAKAVGRGDEVGRPEGASGVQAADRARDTTASELDAETLDSIIGKENFGKLTSVDQLMQMARRVVQLTKEAETLDDESYEKASEVYLNALNIAESLKHDAKSYLRNPSGYWGADFDSFFEDIEHTDADVEAFIRALAGNKENSQSTTDKAATKEEKAAAKQELLDTIGDTVKVRFKKDLGGISGEWKPGITENLIQIALNSDVVGTARHESIHEFFNLLKKNGDEKIQDVLQRVATNKIVMNQLERLLSKHPAALAQIKADPEEAAAFMYQFWRAGMLKVGPQAQTFFEKVKSFLSKTYDNIRGVVRDERHAEMIMASFAKGAFKEADKRAEVVKALNELISKEQDVTEKAGKFTNKFSKALQLVYTAEGMIDLTKNKHLIKLAEMFNQRAGASMVKGDGWEGTYFDGKNRVNAKFQNQLENILDGMEKEDVELVREALATGVTPKIERIEKAVAEMKKLNEDMMDYIDDRNISRLNEDGQWEKMQRRKDFGMPQIWDVDIIAKDTESFKADLIKHHMKELEAIAKQANAEIAAMQKGNGQYKDLGPAAKAAADKGIDEAISKGKNGIGTKVNISTVTPEMVADAIVTRVLMSGGKVDIEESTSELGITPLAASVNRRSLNWINPGAFDKYKQKDLLNIYSSYIAGMTKRGEYTIRFGHGGEVIRDQTDMAMLQEMGGDDLIRMAKARHPAEVKAWAKAKAEAQELGIEFNEPYPTLRMVGNELHKIRVGEEQFKTDMMKAAKELERAVKAIQAMEGTLGMDVSPAVRDLNSWLMTYQNVRLLPFSLFTSLSDVVGLTLNGGTLKDAWDAFVRGMREVKVGVINDSKTMDAAAKRAEAWGTVDAIALNDTIGQGYGSMFMSGAARNISNKFFKKIGMESWNRAMRISASAVAERMISDWAVNGIDTKDSSAKARLERLYGEGADTKQIALDPEGHLDISDPANQAAVMRFVNDAVLRPNAAMRPLWGSNPAYAAFFHLKSFTYAMHKTWLEAALNEARLGNYRPAMVLLSVYLPMGIAAGAAKEMLIPGDEPPWMKGGLDSYLSYGVSKAGLLGVPQMVGGTWDTAFTDMAGPSVSQVRQALFQNPVKTGVAALPGGGTLQRYVE